jgi:hypothetical protein
LEGLGEAQGQPVGEQRGNVISCPSSEPGKTCTVSFQDSGGVPHAVEVGAETLYEAAVLGLKAFREHDCAPGPAAHLDIDVKSPSVRHTVVARKVEEWLTGGARSPSEALEKRRLNCSAAEEKCLWG